MTLIRGKAISENKVPNRAQELWRRTSVKQRMVSKVFGLNREINNEVYGIDDRNLNEEYIPKNYYSINPQHRVKRAWDILVNIYMVYLAMVYPFRVSFGSSISLVEWIIELTMSVIFTIDLILNFLTGYFDEDEIVVRSVSSIIVHYLRGWFFVDLISAFPIFAFSIFRDEFQMDNYRYLLLLPVIRVFKTITKLIQKDWVIYFKAFKHQATYVMRLIKIILLAAYLVHLSACIFMVTAQTTADISTTWIYRVYPDAPTIFQLYIVAVYWSVETLSTIGFGDVTLETNPERIFGIIWLACGSAFYSFLISNLRSVLEQAEANRKDLKSKILAVMKFAQETDLPDDIIQKLKKYLETSHNSQSQTNSDEIGIVDELPYTLRAQILISMNAKVVEQIPFFANKDVDLILRIVPQLKPISLATNEILYREGEYAEEVFFISQGFINLKASNGISFFNYSENFFGEVEAVANVMRIGTAQAAVPTKLFSLEKKAFNEMIKDFPEVGKELTKDNLTNRAELLRRKQNVIRIRGRLASKVFTGTSANLHAIDTTELSKNLLVNAHEKEKAELRQKLKTEADKKIKREIRSNTISQPNSLGPSLSNLGVRMKNTQETKPNERDRKNIFLQLKAFKSDEKLLSNKINHKAENESADLANEEQIKTEMFNLYGKLAENMEFFLESFEESKPIFLNSLEKLEYKCNTADELLASVRDIAQKQEEMEMQLCQLLGSDFASIEN